MKKSEKVAEGTRKFLLFRIIFFSKMQSISKRQKHSKKWTRGKMLLYNKSAVFYVFFFSFLNFNSVLILFLFVLRPGGVVDEGRELH
jgi:hypothetical protein